MTEIDDTIKEFLVESNENIEKLNQELIILENNPESQDTINKIFRIVHTVKGTCGFFDYKKLESVSHVGENLLDSLRAGRVKVSKDIITALLKLSDALSTHLLSIEQSGLEADVDYSELIQTLTSLNQWEEKKKPEQEMPADMEVELQALFLAAQSDYNSTNTISHEEAPIEKAPEIQAPVAAKPVAPPTSNEELKKSELSESGLRVDIGLLDKLMNLVGELVLTRNQILQFTKSQSNSDFISTSQRLNLITSELQEGVMRTRMQPIANVWNKLPRIVRDVSQSCGKQVKLEMFGKETELDKTIIEAIKDPLTHIIRNSVDHGIETPEKRKAAGKAEEGVLTMKAFHEGGQVIIEISDDGAGLNVERIKQKALEKGLISTEKAARMTEQEVQRLIFLPGFSTAEKVTNISGRGVGMDVVRSNIEKIGGTVDVMSRFGYSSIFTIKIPLTLAIIPALIVTANENRFAIPQVNLLELVRLEGEQIDKELEEIDGSMFYRLRGKLLPIIYLRQELGLEPNVTTNKDSEPVLSVVVVRADNHQFGLVVDAIFDTEEIVVKPLGKLLKNVSSFAGTTIMGDGRVALILDVVGIARQAQINKEESSEQDNTSQSASSLADKRKFLIFQLKENRRAAIPLEQVHRLEEFSVDKLEEASGITVVQYRGGILPLIDLHYILGGTEPEYGSTIKAFVYSKNGQHIGFVVNKILDIVEEAVEIEKPCKSRGIAGSAIVQDMVTDIVDLPLIINELYESTNDSQEEAWIS